MRNQQKGRLSGAGVRFQAGGRAGLKGHEKVSLGGGGSGRRAWPGPLTKGRVPSAPPAPRGAGPGVPRGPPPRGRGAGLTSVPWLRGGDAPVPRRRVRRPILCGPAPRGREQASWHADAHACVSGGTCPRCAPEGQGWGGENALTPPRPEESPGAEGGCPGAAARAAWPDSETGPATGRGAEKQPLPMLWKTRGQVTPTPSAPLPPSPTPQLWDGRSRGTSAGGQWHVSVRWGHKAP